VRLPALTLGRRLLRGFLHGLARLILFLCLKVEIRGVENFPRHGPALVVTNHLGDADTPLLLSSLPVFMEAMGKIELYDFPVLGKLMEAYGVIWLHRGLPDRRALRAALEGFSEGRMIIIAPEGRYSLIQGLEEGTDGAAFLARKGNVPIVPVALTGTGNGQVYNHLRRLRRAPVTLTVGVPFRLAGENNGGLEGRGSLKEDTRHIMESLARLLPPEYRGVYSGSPEI
jgi:1-acyl-sn-glycerol-3-phosphate acyltransferase